MVLSLSSPPRPELFEIEPTYPLPLSTPPSFLSSIQEIVLSAIPEEFFFPSLEVEPLFYQLAKQMPFFRSPHDLQGNKTIPITCICLASYTHGVGRYVSDSLARWLIPGKFCPICGEVSLNFRFKAHPHFSFYLTQKMVWVEDQEDLAIAQKNLSQLFKEMKITILAVHHARHLSSLRSQNADNRDLIIQQTLSSMLNWDIRPDESLFEQFQGLFSKIQSEEKSDLIRQNFIQLSARRPKAFDRDLFHEVAQSISLFGKSFYLNHPPRFISRVLAYFYLFRKLLQDNVKKNAGKRHTHFKLLKGEKSHREILSFVFAVNLLSDEERFEESNLTLAFQAVSPNLEIVPSSLIQDRRHEMIRLFYFECRKRDQSLFSPKEIQALQETLLPHLLRNIKIPYTPIFMPRNEEEVLRGVIVLSKQIKYVRDLPQVSIHYEAQSKSDLTFTVIIVQLLKGSTPPLRKVLDSLSELYVEIDDIRSAGSLKKKYTKEAAIVRIRLDKSAFLRSDFSVDILRARQKIVLELSKTLGELRDFNGGIILKQDEALSSLRKSLAPLSLDRDLLLEKYFYSLRPGVMQAVYETEILHAHFSLLEEAIIKNLWLLHAEKGKYLLLFFKSVSEPLKKELLEALHLLRIPSQDLSTTWVEVGDVSYLGLIYRFNYEKEKEVLLSSLHEVMRRH